MPETKTITLEALEAGLAPDFITPPIRARLVAGEDPVAVLRQARRTVDDRMIKRYFEELPDLWAEADIGGRFKACIKMGDHVSMRVLRGAYDKVGTSFVMSQLKPDGAFFDIGSNVGWYTLNAALYYREHGGHVFAFEPQPDVAAAVRRSITANGFEDIVTLHQLALGAEPGALPMRRSRTNTGGAMLDPRDDGKRPTVEIRTLDSFDFGKIRVDCVKIDVEGAEPLVVRGAAKFLRKHRPPILSEINNSKNKQVSGADGREFVGFLEGLGYRAYALGRRGEQQPLNLDDLADARTVDAVFLC